MITPGEFSAVFPSCPDPGMWSRSVSHAWKAYGFDDTNAQSGFLGITGNETGGYTYVRRESMMYSPERAYEVFGSGRTSPCVAHCPLDDGGNVVVDDDGRAFASCIYANMLGNGPFETGDGWRFRGGGIIQLTGRANYQACADSLGLPVELLGLIISVHPPTSAAAAAWFMADYAQILPLLETGSQADFLEAAERVGLPPDAAATQTRLYYWETSMAVLGGGAAPPKPKPPAPAAVPLPPTVSSGSFGSDVTVLQSLLNSCVGLGRPLEVDGAFGTATRDAVRSLQRAESLDDDGVCGPATWAALLGV